MQALCRPADGSAGGACGKMTGMHTRHIEAIERATLAAVAPAAMEELPGWLLGLDPGTVGRSHSAVPLQHSQPQEGVLTAIEARYAAHGRDPVFRLPDVAGFDGLCAALAGRGYARSQLTQVQIGSAQAMARLVQGPAADVAATPDAAWASVFLGEGFDAVDGANRVRALSQAPDAVFASVQVEGRAVAAGMACFSHGWASVHGMRTAPGHRGQGLAGRILATLARQAQARAITSVFLQVEAQNSPAQALYRRAGFGAAWTYAYWRKASSLPGS